MNYWYNSKLYPEYLKQGNACQYIKPIAEKFCQGKGLDIGSGKWPLNDAEPIDVLSGDDAYNLPDEEYNYIFSSHCLEHLPDPIKALEHWRTRLVTGGVLFLYLPHPDMEYWLPQNCKKHLHTWRPEDMAKIVQDLGFSDVFYSERDLAWSFAVTGIREDKRGLSEIGFYR